MGRPMARAEAIAAQLREAAALHQRGALGPAAQLYRQIIDRDPRNADAYHLLALVAHQLGQRALALQLLETALSIAPRHAAALANHALLLREAGDLARARTQAEAALRAAPDYAEAHCALGGILQSERDFTGALVHYRAALRHQPDNPVLLNNIATAARRAGLLSEAWVAVTRAQEVQPDMAELDNTRGNILRDAGYPDLACAAFAAAWARDSGLAGARVNEALTRLLVGDMARGWELFAQRGREASQAKDVPPWDGKADSAIVLLVRAEQGLGDTLQFARLLPWAVARVGHVVLEAPAPLRTLLANSFPGCTVLEQDAALPVAVTHVCRLLDLAGLAGVTVTEIPGAVPWLIAPERTLPSELDAVPTPRIGLVWAGNPGHLNDANRSVRLTQMQPLLDACGPHLLSMQKGPAESELPGYKLADAAPFLIDFAATAAIVQSLDLIVTVDTSVAHLAGALGVPAWIMLPYDPDWRWGLERRDVPWYPFARLYRQPEPGAWTPVVQELARDAMRLLVGDRSVLLPPHWQGSPPCRQASGQVALPGLAAP